jgi:hypothetical protein
MSLFMLSALPEDVLASAVCPFLDVHELCVFAALSYSSAQLLSPRHLGILHARLLASARYAVLLDTAVETSWFLPASSSTDQSRVSHLLQLAWTLRRHDLGRRFRCTEKSMLHKDKIVGMRALSDTPLIAACSFDASVSINHVSGLSGRAARARCCVTNPQLHLHHASQRALTCLTTFDIPNHVQVISAGDKSGNLVVWSSTLFGCEGVGDRFSATSVVDEIKMCVNLSADHIRSIIYMGRASRRQELQEMDLLLVGDGDGRIFVVCIKFHPSNDEGGAARFEISVLQTSWCHEAAVVGLQETSDGFLSMCKNGECGVWSLDSPTTLSSKTGSASSLDHVVHFSLDSLSKIVPAGGRAVTCFVLVSEERKEEAAGRGRRTVVVGTRGCFGSKSKSIRALLKDHCVLGISIEPDGSHNVQWRLPVATTVTSVFPIGRLILVVAERTGDEDTAVSVWDTHTGQEVSRFGSLDRNGSSGGERVTRLLPSFDHRGQLVSWFAGCASGAVLRFHGGSNPEKKKILVAGVSKRK